MSFSVINFAGKAHTIQEEKEAIIIEYDTYKNKAEIDLQTMRDALAEAADEKEMLTKERDNALLTIQNNNEVIFTLTNKNNTLIAGGTWEIGQDVPLPTLSTERKVCTDYRCYNLSGTPHNRLQGVAWTDDIGCRRFNNDYIVALGSFYSTKIGDRFEVTLDTGKIFTIILGDGKADCDTDETNMFTYCPMYGTDELGANLLEFIINSDVMAKECYEYGGIDYYKEFKGNVIRMTYLGRDTSDDWDTYF